MKKQVGENISSTGEELWNSALQGKGANTKTRTKKSEVIHFSQFEAAAEKVSDPFWKDTLKLCARRKFPKGFLYGGGVLKHRGSSQSLNVMELDSESAAGAIVTFLRENGKIYSPIDEVNSKSCEDLVLEDMISKYSDWSKIFKSSSRRSQYVWSFVFENFEELPPALKKELYTKINIGFELGYLIKEDVVFEFGRIISIEGISLVEGRIEYMRPVPIKKRKIETKAASKSKNHCHYKNWLDYLEELSKQKMAGFTRERVIPSCSSSQSCSTLSES